MSLINRLREEYFMDTKTDLYPVMREAADHIDQVQSLMILLKEARDRYYLYHHSEETLKRWLMTELLPAVDSLIERGQVP